MEEKEYLKKLEYLGDYIIGDYQLKSHKYYKELHEYLEAITQANPSEAIECLEYNSKLFDEIALENPTTYKNETFVDAFLFGVNAIKIKQALRKAQKLEKENAKYKQLEEQLGCPLEVIMKAVTNGLWHITPNNGIVFKDNRDYVITLRGYVDSEPTIMVRKRYPDKFDGNWGLEDYKKTWWLKEDKSE